MGSYLSDILAIIMSNLQSQDTLENHLTVELIESLNKGLPEGEFIWGYYVRVFGGQLHLEYASKKDRCYYGQFSDYAGECVPAESFVFQVEDRVCILSYEHPENPRYSYFGKVILPTKELAADFVKKTCETNKQINNHR